MEAPPSQWQLKYRRPPRQDDDDDNQSLTEWIAKVQEKATEAAALETELASTSLLDAPLTSPTLVNLEPVDDDVAEVMARMEKILSGALDDDNSTSDVLSPPPLEFDDLSFDVASLSIDAAPIDIELERLPPIHKFDKGSFCSEQMILLFQKNRDEKTLRKCLRFLANHCKCEKKRLGRSLTITQTRMQGKMLGKYFLLWKHIARMAKVKETVLICKFGRVTSKTFREAFSLWRRLVTDHTEIRSVAFDKRRLRILCHTFSSWRNVICESKHHSEVSLASSFVFT